MTQQLQFRKNWLKGTEIQEYRAKLLASLQFAQQNYYKRQNRQAPQPDPLPESKYKSEMPLVPMISTEQRLFVKQSRSIFGKLLKRYVILENNELVYFKKPNSNENPKKRTLLEGHAEIQTLEEVKNGGKKFEKWDPEKELDKENHFKYRVGIFYKPNRLQKGLYLYTNDLHEAKIISAAVKFSSLKDKGNFENKLSLLAKYQVNINLCCTFWSMTLEMYEKRQIAIMKYHFLSEAMIVLSNKHAQKAKQTVKSWNDLNMKRKKKVALRSTFQFGQLTVKPKSDFNNALKLGNVVEKSMQKVSHFVSTARLLRQKDRQQMLDRLLNKEKMGIRVTHVQLTKSDFRGKLQKSNVFELAALNIDPSKRFLCLESIEKRTGEHQQTKIDLKQISQLAASDYYPYDLGEKVYNFSLYGRVQQQRTDNNILENVPGYAIGYDDLNRVPDEVLQIQIHEIEVLNKRFLQQRVNKSQVRVYVVQKTKLRDFQTHSRSFPMHSSQVNTNSYKFNVERLNQQDYDEEFSFNIAQNFTERPLGSFHKELIGYVENKQTETIPLKEQLHAQDIIICDKEGQQMYKLTYSIRKKNSGGNVQLRYGARLQVGRFVIVDQKKQARVLSINRDSSTDVEYIPSRSRETNVQRNRLSLIEKQSVPVYQTTSLPKEVKDSQYEWIVEFNSSDHSILALLQRAISECRMQLYYEQILQAKTEIPDHQISGDLRVCILEAKNLSQKCNSFVQVNRRQNSIKTQVIPGTNSPNWVTQEKPVGEVVTLQKIRKSDEAIQFQVVNSSNNSVLGQVDLPMEQVMDFNQPGKLLVLPLQSEKPSYAILLLSTIFIPDDITCIQTNQRKHPDRFISGEAFKHYEYMKKTQEIDEQNFPVPLCEYDPNEIERISQFDKKTQEVIAQSNPILITAVMGKSDKTSVPSMIFYQNLACSADEGVCRDLKRMNDNRPLIEESSMLFKYLWRHDFQTSRYQAFMDQQTIFWNEKLNQISEQKNIKYKKLQVQFDPDASFMDEEILEQLTSIVSQDIGSNQKTIETPLVYRGAIEQKDREGLYSDLYFLTNSGIPNQSRQQYWSDILKVPFLKQAEQTIMKMKLRAYSDQRSVYQNLLAEIELQDCLAFRQIDEDTNNLVFPDQVHANKKGAERDSAILEDKVKIRRILKALVFWSKNRQINGKNFTFGYTLGIMKIIHRLIQITSEEACYWIINAMVRVIPRLFSMSNSSLEGDRLSLMRSEMTTFKSILRQNLPSICDKIQQLGLSIENLVYDSITSFYAYDFSSEMLYRIWDMMIFAMGTGNKQERKRALWYVLSPAYYVLSKKQTELESAQTPEQLRKAFKNGFTITYDPDQIINDLKDIVTKMFVSKNKLGRQPTAQTGIFGSFFGGGSQKLDAAAEMEKRRNEFEDDIDLIFKNTEKENQKISQLIENENYDRNRWYDGFLEKFRRISLAQKGNNVQSQERDNLDFHAVHFLVHNVNNFNPQHHILQLSYGKSSDQMKKFQLADSKVSNRFVKGENLEEYFEFYYKPGFNSFKFEIYNQKTKQIDYYLNLDLHDFQPNTFYKKAFTMYSETECEKAENAAKPMVQVDISTLIVSHSDREHELRQQSKDAKIQLLIKSIKQKLPDKLDIFNKEAETLFKQELGSNFDQIIKTEFNFLQQILNHQDVVEVINYQFNYSPMVDDQFMNQQDLQLFVQQCFEPQWAKKTSEIYELMTAPSEMKTEEEDLPGGTKGAPATLGAPGEKSPFCLRNFIVSLVLMSQLTVDEKLEILFKVFDWNDGVADGLDLSTINLLTKTCFERNLYYWPSHELANTVEYIFEESNNLIYKAVLTQEQNVTSQTQCPTLEEYPNLSYSAQSSAKSINVTKQVQKTFTLYQRMFGNKNLDFNFETSAFKNIRDILGKQLPDSFVNPAFRLCLFCESGQERSLFEIKFDAQGDLVLDTINVARKNVQSFLARNQQKLFLQGRTKGVERDEFLRGIQKIPFLTDFMRAESFYRDYGRRLESKKAIRKLEFRFYLGATLFQFFFDAARRPGTEDSVMRDQEQDSFSITTTAVHMEDTFVDVRSKIEKALRHAIHSNRQVAEYNQHVDILKEFNELNLVVNGQTEEKTTEFVLKQFDRLFKHFRENKQQIFRLEKVRHTTDVSLGYDCYSIYKHADGSTEWRPCKITKKEPKPDFDANRKYSPTELECAFHYMVEFKHHAGQYMWFKRNREDLLFSARYARDNQRSFDSECLEFISEAYRGLGEGQKL